MSHKKKIKSGITTIQGAKGIKSLKPIKPCHPVTEVWDNLYLCGIGQVKQMIDKYDIDVLVPLDHVVGTVWEWGFDGKIIYYPIDDFHILPENILNRLVNEVLEQLRKDKRVGIFCIGGHGRTGYIAACILGKIGIEDPIEWVRKMYCNKAIESNGQIKSIANYLNMPELYDRYKEVRSYMGYGLYGGYGFDDYDYLDPFGVSDTIPPNFNWTEYCMRSSPLNRIKSDY